MKKVLENNVLIALLSGIILAILSFPHYDLTLQTGIDPPLKWVFTNFALEGFQSAQYLTFPHGPLAFLMYPLEETLWFTAITTLLLKTYFVFLLTRLFSEMCFLRWVQILGTAYLIFVLASFNQLLIAGVLASYLVFFKTENSSYKMSGFLLTSIAVFVKSYVAILTGMITVLFILYYLWKKREFLLTLIDASILSGLLISIWLFLFGSFEGFIDFFYGMLQLAQDNSSAAAYYPINNWFYLVPFLLVIAIIPFVQKSKRAVFFGILVVPSLFGAWKHGMAREDIYHVKGLFTYVAVVYLLYFLFERKNRFVNLICLSSGLYLFSLNMPNAENYKQTSFNWLGLDDLSQLSAKNDESAIVANRLPQEIKKVIGKSTVDIYPWDYSIIAANNLNWQPRPVIHSYAAYTPWLDNRDAQHFASRKRPKYIIWELDKIGGDVNASQMHSIDGRYLLNNEPLTMLQLLSSYEAIHRNHKFLLLKEKKQLNDYKSKIIEQTQSKMNTWIEVPETETGLLRANVQFNKSFLQRVKSFTYKDEQFWIQLYLNSGQIHRYRIVPKNAVNGLWIAPYIHNLDTKLARVDSIRFISSNPLIMDENLSIEWEQITFNSENVIDAFFNLKESINYSEVIREKHGFNGKNENWMYDFGKIKRSNHNSFYQTDEEYCVPYTLTLSDSIPDGKYEIWAQLNLKSDVFPQDLQLVISSGSGDNGFWYTTFLKKQMIVPKDWNNVISTSAVELKQSNKELKVYIYNPNRRAISLDDIEVILRKVK